MSLVKNGGSSRRRAHLPPTIRSGSEICRVRGGWVVDNFVVLVSFGLAWTMSDMRNRFSAKNGARPWSQIEIWPNMLPKIEYVGFRIRWLFLFLIRALADRDKSIDRDARFVVKCASGQAARRQICLVCIGIKVGGDHVTAIPALSQLGLRGSSISGVCSSRLCKNSTGQANRARVSSTKQKQKHGLSPSSLLS